ncbi:MAG: GTP cyclohydrolase I FolE [Acidobacteriota bacterium]|nr:GTP cyclohydrolase I FolE [Acidobacteriota bacterium]
MAAFEGQCLAIEPDVDLDDIESTGPKAPERPSKDEVRQAVRTILSYIGENPNREGLQETPDRLVRSYGELYRGYQTEIKSIMKTFTDGAEQADEMVIQRNIPFFSMCEHHMLPFVGVAHIAYLPDKKIVGLSKMARLVEVFARRLQVQERMTAQISEALMTYLQPKGAACVIEATHLCMAQRGVSKSHSDTVTSSLRGVFKEAKTRSEFLNFITSDTRRHLI